MSPRFSAVLDRRSRSRQPSDASQSPPASRIQRRWWADTRVILGLVLLVSCTLIGARVVTMSNTEVEVWQVQRDLSAGAMVSAADLAPVGVDPRLADTYTSVADFPRQPLARDVRAGELLDLGAVADAQTRDVRWVTLPIEPLHAPADLAPGDRVDVWATPDSTRSFDTDGGVSPDLVLPAALVTAIDVDARGFAGDYGVVVEVSPDEAGPLLAAVRAGMIDLVRVPHGIDAPDNSAGDPRPGEGQATASNGLAR